ncbi:terpene synthase-like [Bicyclus anynana]|uniref:Terpene synthase-like n=1 Tax=Bicyclus anynana TaxID=110368 RepID=A0ABM3LNV8_BICAN|nr:terpene synthase-like [Bicyclus anynana]
MALDIINTNIHLEKEILAPYSHLMQMKGKQIRVKICRAFNFWLHVPEDKERYIVDTVAMLHNGSLLMDDIQDNSTIRRGIPAAHCVYGVPLTINASSHIYFLVIKRILKLGVAATQVFSEEILELFRGQGIDIYWRDNFICPTEEEYKDMLKQKTGHMFILGARLMQIFSKNKTDFSNFALLLGLYFQIRDDYCNLTQQEAQKDISFCEDLTEGKYSLPIIHAEKFPESKEILSGSLWRQPSDGGCS